MVEETSLIRTNRSVSSSPPSDVHWCLVLASHCSRQMGPSSPSLFLCRHDHYYYSITHRTTASRALFSPSFFNGGGPTPRLILSIQQLQETISSSAETRHILHCCCVLSLCYGSGPPLNMYRKSALCMADGALFNNPQMSRWCCCSIGIKQTRGTPKSPAAGLPRINKEETRGQDKRGPHRRQQSDYITVTLVNLLLLLRRDRFYSFHVYWCYTSNIYSADKSQQVIKNGMDLPQEGINLFDGHYTIAGMSLNTTKQDAELVIFIQYDNGLCNLL